MRRRGKRSLAMPPVEPCALATARDCSEKGIVGRCTVSTRSCRECLFGAAP